MDKTIKKRKTNFKEEVFRKLKSEIIEGRLKPRQLLSINGLSVYFEVGRTPVREALIMLEKEGWVEFLPQRGALVSSTSAKEISDIIEMQVLVEGYLTWKASDLITTGELEETRAILEKAENSLNEKMIDDYQRYASEFHQYIARITENKKLENSSRDLAESFDRIRPFLRYIEIVPLDKSLSQHWDIWEAMKARKPDKAKNLMEHHMSWFKERLLYEIEKSQYL